MPPRTAKIQLERVAERLAALPGVDRLREAAAGMPVYLVGGAVRDLLLGRERTDIDIAVEGDVSAVAGRIGGDVLEHERFTTASVQIDGLHVDLAATRAETYPHPGALPEVRPASLAEDLARRDFTINAMAMPLTERPALIDPHDGRGDLERGELRVLHDDSFVDDPTRALRGARYAARYGFDLEGKTAKLIRAADLSTVSADRVAAELRKLAAETEAQRGFELLAEWGVMELGPGAPELIAAVTELVASEPWARVVPRRDAVLAAALGRGLAAARELASADPARPSEAVALASGHSAAELALGRAMGAEWLDRYLNEWRDVRLEIDGGDLLTAGIPEGPAIGHGLGAALRAKLDGEAGGREAELRAALAAARENDTG